MYSLTRISGLSERRIIPLHPHGPTTTAITELASRAGRPIRRCHLRRLITPSTWAWRQETQLEGGPSGGGRHYGNVTYSAQYDWGGTTPVVATTNTIAVNGSGNCSGVAATVNNKVCS